MGLSVLPLADGRTDVKVFQSLGWSIRRDSTHIVLTHPGHPNVTLSIPNHREVRKPTLKQIIAAAGLTDKQYRVIFDAC